MSDDLDLIRETGLLAIDVGSSRLKLGWFPPASACSEKPENELAIAAPQLREPELSFAIDHGSNLAGSSRDAIYHWLKDEVQGKPPVVLASVRPVVAAAIQELLAELSWSAARQLTYQDLPLRIEVDAPERVGIDRLLDAVGANRLRDSSRPAIVVDLGTAGTVDLISEDGTFQGGSILPGMSLSAKALHGATASLPQLEEEGLGNGISAVGKNTEAAIASGLFWGTVGAINELIARLVEQCETAPHLFVTGGGASNVLRYLKAPEGSAKFLPQLILSSICVVVED